MGFWDEACDMDIYGVDAREVGGAIGGKIKVVEDVDELSRAIACESSNMLAEKQRAGEVLTAICLVGPLD